MATTLRWNPGADLVVIGLCGLLTGAAACSSGGSGTKDAGGSGGSTQGGTGGSGGSQSGSGGSGATGSGGSNGQGGSGSGGTGAGGSPGDAGADTGSGACNTSPGMALQFRQTIVDLMTGDLGTDLPPGDVPRTIEAWVKYTGPNSWRAEQTIMETSRATGGQNRVLGLDNSGYTAGTMIAQFGPYTNGYSDNNNPNGVFVPNIPQVGWVHLSWSYTGNHGTLSFTVNGTQYPITTQAGAPTLSFTTGVVTLGASQNFGFGGFDGILDEVRIWSVARTPTEVARDMKVVLKGTEPGLVAYYRFEEGTGTFTDDVTKKAAHRLSVCAAMSGQVCGAANTANPMWIASDLPGPFTCAP
jgi:hypothetical protein